MVNGLAIDSGLPSRLIIDFREESHLVCSCFTLIGQLIRTIVGECNRCQRVALRSETCHLIGKTLIDGCGNQRIDAVQRLDFRIGIGDDLNLIHEPGIAKGKRIAQRRLFGIVDDVACIEHVQ